MPTGSALPNVSWTRSTMIFLEETYTAGVEALKNKYPELFEGANATRCQIWAISNWNKELRAAQCKRRRTMN